MYVCVFDIILQLNSWFFSGEGLTNIKNELIKWTQNTMLDKLTYTKEELQVIYITYHFMFNV